MTLMDTFKQILPWRIYHPLAKWLENDLREISPSIYKFVKFGRTNINTPDYWNQVWSKDKIQRNYQNLFKLIIDRIPPNAKVIDIGCGVGRLSKLIKEKCSVEVVGLDFSSWACKQLSKDGFETIVSTLPQIPIIDNSFDVAIATEVLEHLDKPERTIKEMARVVKSGGIIMCSMPNNMLHPSEELEHQQSFDKTKIKQIFKKYTTDIELKTGRLLEDSNVEFLFVYGIVI